MFGCYSSEEEADRAFANFWELLSANTKYNREPQNHVNVYFRC